VLLLSPLLLAVLLLLLLLLLQVYEATRAAAAWPDLLLPHQTLGVHCLHFYNNSNVTNSQLVQRRVRDAVCDAVRDDRYVCFCVWGGGGVLWGGWVWGAGVRGSGSGGGGLSACVLRKLKSE